MTQRGQHRVKTKTEAEAGMMELLQPLDHQTPEAGERPGRVHPWSPPEGVEREDHSWWGHGLVRSAQLQGPPTGPEPQDTSSELECHRTGDALKSSDATMWRRLQTNARMARLCGRLMTRGGAGLVNQRGCTHSEHGAWPVTGPGAES